MLLLFSGRYQVSFFMPKKSLQIVNKIVILAPRLTNFVTM
ncbi:hypothetical protein HMPREF3189_00478 [Clostridiales bacterium KA00134]|nr:hypothetical protein HMPREF3189_00478 [Clostridiales bacterium KA00134]